MKGSTKRVYAQLTHWSLRRRPWRTLLTAVSVALTVAVLIAFFSVRSEIQKYLEAKDAIPHQRLWVKPRNLAAERGQMYPLTLKDKLGAIPGVEKVLYFRSMGTQMPDGTRMMIFGAVSEALHIDRDFWPLTDAELADWTKERTGAVVSQEFAKQFNLRKGGTWEVPTAKGPMSLKISGILGKGAAQAVVGVHFEYVDELNGREGVVNDYRVVLAKTTDARPIVKAVDELMSTYAVHLVSEDTMLQLRGVKQSHVVPNLLGILGLVLLITTTMGIANSTMISVRERRAELATLRVLGVKRRVLALAVVGESMVVCLLGGLGGALVAWIAMRDGLNLNALFLENLKINTTGLIAGLAASMLVPLLGSTFASWLAVRAPLHEALRDVG